MSAENSQENLYYQSQIQSYGGDSESHGYQQVQLGNTNTFSH